ncbi:MAG: hypothetical protein J3K34DRAFT_65544 [Monoraphidium minutum]|nr:MAG: hypothetical protein J3K34DRAFT_65544 [Monoraphidium minutum]
MQSNQRVSKTEISGSFKADASGFNAVSGASGLRGPGKTITIEREVKTNTQLPSDSCARVGSGNYFDPNEARACIMKWLDQPGNAVYTAYAIPWVYHPDFQAALGVGRRKARRLLQDIPPTPEPDYRFKDTGLLQLRLKSIQTTLDKYRFKDAFWHGAQASVDDAQQHVSDLLAGLRNQSVNSVSTWHNLYLTALGRVNAASEKSNWVPKGARCGWCTRQSLEQSQGSCTSTCSTPLDCKLSCPGRAPIDCTYNGYTYTAFTGEQACGEGTSTETQCKVSVTSNACVEYGLSSTALTGECQSE